METRYNIRMQGCYEDVVRPIHRVSNEDGVVIENIGSVNALLPEETIQELQPYLGRRVAVLRTNLPGREYIVHVCDRPSTLGRASALQRVACA